MTAKSSAQKNSVLVIGAGISGLTSAYMLSDAGYDVTIYTKDDTNDTVSAVAGAYWEPYLVQPADKVTAWSKFTYDYAKATIVPDTNSGICTVEVNSYHDPAVSDPSWREAVDGFQHLGSYRLSDTYASAWRYDSLVFDTPVYLPWLLGKLEDNGVKIERREVKSFDEISDDFGVIVNCTGLGAIQLCNDTEMYPVRGQVLRVALNGFDGVVFDANDDSILYVIPRSKDIIIGGTSQMNNWNVNPDPEDSKKVINKLKAVYPEFGEITVLEEKAGLRPVRSEVRLEVERIGSKTIVHNYGHGGAGYTLSWGCANDVLNLVKESIYA